MSCRLCGGDVGNVMSQGCCHPCWSDLDADQKSILVSADSLKLKPAIIKRSIRNSAVLWASYDDAISAKAFRDARLEAQGPESRTRQEP